VRPTPAAPTPAPALGAILSAEKRKQLDAEYVADLGQANQILGRLTGKTLSAEQRDSVSRAQAFIRQAAQFHNRDLATAAELARRARVLTQDLANALR
jgi:membrane-bound ClpP family serine protease